MAMPPEVTERIKASPAEQMVMIEQCEAMKVAIDRYITALRAGHLAILPERFYEIQAPHEYLAKVLSTRIEAAMHEAHQHEEKG